MKKILSLVGMSFLLGGVIATTAHQPYAVLAASEAVILQGEGTEESPYLVTSGEELEWVVSQVLTYNATQGIGNDFQGKYLKLTNDVSITLPGATITTHTLRGTFDGDNHKITLSAVAGVKYASMFGYIGATGTFKNVVFEGSITNTSEYLAPVCIYNVGKIENVTNNATLGNTSDNTVVGGIAAFNNLGYNSANKKTAKNTGSITNCTNNGSIVGKQYVGGIVGQHGAGTIGNCLNTGDVTGSSSSIGGIVGLSGVDAGSTADVTTLPYTFSNCINTGDVSGSGLIGGICGGLYTPGADSSASFLNCENYGDIYGLTNGGTGGIAGYINNTKTTSSYDFTNCISVGTVYLTNGWGGGFIGYPSSASVGSVNIDKCLNVSKVIDSSSTGRVGGFIPGQGSNKVAFTVTNTETLNYVSSKATSNISNGVALSTTNITSELEINSSTVALSEDLFTVVKAVKDFVGCKEEIASTLSTSYSKLTNEELMLLQEITMRYEDTTSSYGVDAAYINNWYQGRTSSSYILSMEKNNVFIAPFIIASVLSIGALVLISYRKKQKNK